MNRPRVPGLLRHQNVHIQHRPEQRLIDGFPVWDLVDDGLQLLNDQRMLSGKVNFLVRVCCQVVQLAHIAVDHKLPIPLKSRFIISAYHHKVGVRLLVVTHTTRIQHG